MLVGRDDLLNRIDWLVASGRAGAGAALLLRGDPGSGKTALLRAAVAAARESLADIVTVSGVEDERELPYAGLHALLRALAADEVDLVPAHRAALDRALGRDDAGSPAPLVVATAALAVLDARSSRTPLLVAVDDLHWVDAETRDVLGFVCRRIGDNAVAIVMGSRPPMTLAGVETVEVGDLDAAAARELLQREGATDQVARQLVEAVGGNPLALLEILRTLSPAERDGSQHLRAELPLTTAGEAYAALLRGASAEARRAGGIAAVAGDIPPRQLHTVLEREGVPWTGLVGVESLGLVELTDSGIRWRHPLARAAARDALPAEARRAAHRATAEVLAADDGDPATTAWHFVRAASGPDVELAGRIASVADTAAARGAHSAAADAYEAGARLDPDRIRAAGALARSGLERWYAAEAERSRALLTSAAPDLVDDDLSWEVAMTLAQVVGALDSPSAAHASHLAAVDVARAQQRPDRLVHALANAFNSSTHVGQEATDRVVTDIVAAADPRDAVQVVRRDAVQGFADLAVDQAESGRRHLDDAISRIEADGLLDQAPDLLQMTVQAIMWSGQTQRLRPEIARVIAQMTSSGDLRLLPATVRGLAWCDYAAGQWSSAAELADEALDLARIGNRAVDVCDSLSQVATIEGVRGHVEVALDLAEEARTIAAQLGSVGRRADACWADCLALIGVGDTGRLGEAAPRFAEAVRAVGPGLMQPEYFDAPIALVIAGRRTEGSELHAELLTGLGDDQRPEMRVGSMLCRLHLVDDDAELATAALALADGLVGENDYAFGRARLRLAVGAMTRRLGQRTQARRILRAAEQEFEALGAAPWIERTRDELRSSGATLRSAAQPHAGLTASEARVCRAAATGMSTKEIAASLFLSPKTVEFHLGRIFRKLGVRSRAELVSAVARDGL